MIDDTGWIRYECVGGPHDGREARARRGARFIELGGERYYVTWLFSCRAAGRHRPWRQPCLVWEHQPLGGTHDAQAPGTPEDHR